METGTIECRALTKRYGKGPTALKRLSFSIPTKGIFALIGRNGAGKTTLIRILATELAPTSGTALINGIDVVKEPERIRAAIAVLPQEARAIPWLTAEQEVFSSLLYRGIGYAESKRRTAAVLEEFGLAKYKAMPSRKLSGGTKRKLLVAAIVATGAKILFVDEPTTGLDPLSRAEMWTVLNRLKRDHFIFLTTHYLEEAERLADNIGIIDKGRLMGIGTLDKLRKRFRYQYSIRILKPGHAIKPRHGEAIIGADGTMQILTTEDEANKLSSELIKGRVRFSMNPLSLEDIFYYLVKKPIEEEETGGGEEW